jgi:hypothetical protein
MEDFTPLPELKKILDERNQGPIRDKDNPPHKELFSMDSVKESIFDLVILGVAFVLIIANPWYSSRSKILGSLEMPDYMEKIKNILSWKSTFIQLGVFLVVIIVVRIFHYYDVV